MELFGIREVKNIQQALEISALRMAERATTRPTVFVDVDNTPITRKLIKAEARKYGLSAEDLRQFRGLPPYISRCIVVGALCPFTNFFN